MDFRALVARLSISTRLTLWFGTSLLVLLTLFVTGFYVSVHLGLHDDLEARLREEAAAVQAHFRAHSGASLTGSSSSPDHAFQTPPSTFVRLLGPGGEVIRASPSFQARPPLSIDLPASPASTLKTRSWSGTSVQSLYVPLEKDASPVAWMEVTKLQSPIHRQLHALRWLLAVGIVIGVGIAVLVGYGLARRALRPVAALTDAANEMKDRPAGTLPTDFGREDELTELADTFNDLIGRLRDSLQRERRFRADAAHNMFTPLTAIQSELDVTLRKPRSDQQYRDVLETVQRHTADLSEMLDKLMTLSQIEARDGRSRAARLDVGPVVRTRVDRVRPRADTQNISFDCRAPAGCEVRMESEDLALVTDHLLDNALKYTSGGGSVQVMVRRHGEDVVLRVSDTGVGFSPDEADRLFDRFYRGAEAADGTTGGGLGLSIVRALVRSCGGTIAARSDGLDTGSTFTVRLPRLEVRG
ncbi:MAG: ATP-binding protein [Salinibacter sp.]